MALQVLFQLEFAPQISADQAIELYRQNLAINHDDFDFCSGLVAGVLARRQDIDNLIQARSQNWKLSRMSKVDLCILRLASHELHFAEPRLDAGIVINEAVELAKSFSTTESASFVNGILDTMAQAQRDST